jgi:hypothetical protein
MDRVTMPEPDLAIGANRDGVGKAGVVDMEKRI